MQPYVSGGDASSIVSRAAWSIVEAMSELGRVLILLGLLLVVAGLVVAGLSLLHLPLGRLPGDMTWRGRNWRVSFPLATSLIISLLLTLILWVIGRFRR
ncbi:MAG: DUF2905 domain-containing protein [Acidobacteriaceae bacterium]|nr:DUF2905 domain-containing protein [Acidobacteriaceae bacterium]